jgi:hypothetical protein
VYTYHLINQITVIVLLLSVHHITALHAPHLLIISHHIIRAHLILIASSSLSKHHSLYLSYESFIHLSSHLIILPHVKCAPPVSMCVACAYPFVGRVRLAHRHLPVAVTELYSFIMIIAPPLIYGAHIIIIALIIIHNIICVIVNQSSITFLHHCTVCTRSSLP